jgi:hypothetical protein
LPEHFAGQATAVFPRRCRQVLQVKSVLCHGVKKSRQVARLGRMKSPTPLGLVAHFAPSFDRAQTNEDMATSAGPQKPRDIWPAQIGHNNGNTW